MIKFTDFSTRSRKILAVLAMLALACFSGGVLYWLWESKMGWVANTTEFIKNCHDNVMLLIASASGVSAGITLLPGDVATPVATELARLGNIFLVSLCALYVEEFLALVSGGLVFRVLLPVACGLLLIGILMDNDTWKALSWKVAVFSLAVLLVVPTGVWVSSMVEEKYRPVIEQAKESAELMEQSVGENRDEEGAGSGLSAIMKNLQTAGETIAGGTDGMLRYLKNMLKYYMDSLAVMLVVSCVIPLLVVLALLWCVKLLFQVDPFLLISDLTRRGKSHKNHLKGEKAHAEQRELAEPAE